MPTKFYFLSLPATTSLKALVRAARLRWRVERDYQELKQEIGLDHFEGRMWRGFHHHAALCAVAHAFLEETWSSTRTSHDNATYRAGAIRTAATPTS